MHYTVQVLDDLLQKTGIERSDAEILLSAVLQKPRSWILTHQETKLTHSEQKLFESWVLRRAQHEPIAYILGEKEFYGRRFFVDKRVLIPRPSTEILVDEVKRIWEILSNLQDRTYQYTSILVDSSFSTITPADSEIVIFTHLKKALLPASSTVCCDASSGLSMTQQTGAGLKLSRRAQHDTVSFSIIDIGTGSGCIGITLALEIPEAQILCTDISEGTLEVARENAKHHGVLDRVTFEKSQAPSTKSQENSKHQIPNNQQTSKPANFLIVSNPPYIPCTSRACGRSGTGQRPHSLPPDVFDFEPHEALFAGPEGMDVLGPLVEHCMKDTRCIGCVIECREEQAKKLSSLF